MIDRRCSVCCWRARQSFEARSATIRSCAGGGAGGAGVNVRGGGWGSAANARGVLAISAAWCVSRVWWCTPTMIDRRWSVCCWMARQSFEARPSTIRSCSGGGADSEGSGGRTEAIALLPFRQRRLLPPSSSTCQNGNHGEVRPTPPVSEEERCRGDRDDVHSYRACAGCDAAEQRRASAVVGERNQPWIATRPVPRLARCRL